MSVPVLSRAVQWRSVLLVLLAVWWACGCRNESPLPEGRTPPNPSGPAAYGPLQGGLSTNLTRKTPASAPGKEWRSAPFFIVESELSPATIVHSSSRYLGLFTQMAASGLGSPSHVAWSTRNGPRAFKRGESLDVTVMEENWLLVWFAGSAGWTRWDSPWAIFLQHKPGGMKLEESGLHLSFTNEVGDVVLMPLYGYYKPPVQGADYLEQHGLPSRQIKTWEWPATLTRDPLVRLRYWAGASRSLPIGCEDSFSVDRARDSVTIRSRFEWYSIADDWKTRPIRLAPVSPTLALVAAEKRFPVRFTGPSFDMELPTPFGPYVGVQDVDSFDATFSVLQYVHEAEVPATVRTNSSPGVIEAARRLRTVLAVPFDPVAQERTGVHPLVAAGRYARALPFVDGADRTNAASALRRYFADQVLQPSRDWPAETELEILPSLWAYAHYSGDWSLVRERWPVVRAIRLTTGNERWAALADATTARMGREAAACAAMARLAYRAGDPDTYTYACSLFARQLVHLWARQQGGDYFRRQQPWHSMEFIPEPAYLTRLAPDRRGWLMESPKTAGAAEGQLRAERWKDFEDGDLGRFVQDYLAPDVSREFQWSGAAQRTNRELPGRMESFTNSPPSIALRSWLWSEPASTLAPDPSGAFAGSPAEILGQALAILRSSEPVRYERLIPPGDPTPYVVGVEREVVGPHPGLLTTLAYSGQAEAGGGASSPGWPQLTWREWRTPSGDPWTFGQIKPVRSGAPREVRDVPLNWNTRAVLFSLPEK